MEIKTDKPEELKRRLIEFGVRQVEFEDTSRFYFQAPGGPVFRVYEKLCGIQRALELGRKESETAPPH